MVKELTAKLDSINGVIEQIDSSLSLNDEDFISFAVLNKSAIESVVAIMMDCYQKMSEAESEDGLISLFDRVTEVNNTLSKFSEKLKTIKEKENE